MSNRKYIVYKHTNLINRKVYIGQTCQKPRIRWNYGLGYKHNKHFYAAIKKYGWNNFSHEILYENLSKKEADELETKLIEQYQTENKDICYNVAIGGSSRSCYNTKEEVKQARQKIQHNAYIKMISNEEYAQKMRDKSLETYYENKNNVEFLQTRAKSNKKVRTKVKNLRQQLKELYLKRPELFSEDDYIMAFGYKKINNKNKNYICNAHLKLEALLNKLKEQII